MSNTAVLFNALQPQSPSLPVVGQLHHRHHLSHSHTAATTTMMNTKSNPNSPTRHGNSSTGSSSHSPSNNNTDNSIRRGADIVRQHIQQQQQQEQQCVMTMNTTTNIGTPSTTIPTTTTTATTRTFPKNSSSNNNNSTYRSSSVLLAPKLQQQEPSSKQPSPPQPQQSSGFHYCYDSDDDEEVTTEDHISVTSWSEYDAPPEYQNGHSNNTNNAGGNVVRGAVCNVVVGSPSISDWFIDTDSVVNGGGSVEIGSPYIADWSIDADTAVNEHTDDEDRYCNNNGVTTATTTTKNAKKKKKTAVVIHEDDSLFHYCDNDDDNNAERGTTNNGRSIKELPSPIANYDNTTMLMMNRESTNAPPNHTTTTTVDGFISSDDDDNDECNSKNDDANDQDDSNSDIVEIVNGAMFDPFTYSSSPIRIREPQQRDTTKVLSSPNNNHKIGTKLLSTTATTPRSNNGRVEQSLPPNTVKPGGIRSSSNNHNTYVHLTIGLSSPPSQPNNNRGGIQKGYPLPFNIQQQQQESSLVVSSMTDHKKNNSRNNVVSNTNGTSTMNNQQQPSFFMDYGVDTYCGYNVDVNNNDDDDDDGEQYYESPEKPAREGPIHTSSTMIRQQHHHGHQSYGRNYFSQTSSAKMMLYDQLLCDPAYLHAQNAGFIWQSIVGQHIRFPTSWWDGARGPPITSDTDDTNNDTDNIPWMYFGRHTISDHPVLNQLVKCRASAGRLLLHIVVQDLMTRTPIQDIVIGCFHPNSKGIRTPPNSPALKRLEHCRDIWMAVRKRSHTSVAATDSLLYSPSHWANNNNNNNIGGSSTSRRSNNASSSSSAYNYSISRSPLGSGQRVTNQNVRGVFGDKSPLETIFLSEDELYERLAARILQQQYQSSRDKNTNQKPATTDTNTANNVDMSPPLAVLQELVFA